MGKHRNVNMGKMKKAYDEHQRGGDLWSVPEGESLVYVHPPCRDNDSHPPTEGMNFIPVVVHYGVGKKNAMVASLDPEVNSIITHPFVKAYLRKRNPKVKLTGRCPVAEARESGSMDDEERDDTNPSTRFVWGITQIAHRARKTGEFTRIKKPMPQIMMAGKTIFDGIMDVFLDNGDITDPLAAVLVRIHRRGKKIDTKYKIVADNDSVAKPVKLKSGLRKRLEKALVEGGDCDLFRYVANLIKSESDVEALLAGVKIDPDESDDDDDIEDDEDEGGAEDSDDGDDGDEESDDDDGDEEGGDDDGDEESDDDDGDEESDDDDDDDGDEESDDDDGDEESDDEDEDEDDELPVPKSAKKPKGGTRKAMTDEELKAKLGQLDAKAANASPSKVDKDISRVTGKKGKKSRTKGTD